MKRRSTNPQDPLQIVPGIGPSMARDLRDLGIRKVADLASRDPQEMYDALCALREARQDRCVLYVFRCAVYYAGRTRHDPDKLLWWNWTDDRMNGRRGLGRAGPGAPGNPARLTRRG